MRTIQPYRVIGFEKGLINGQKPEFGNPDHIQFVKMIDEIFKGEASWHEIEWQFCHYWGAHDHSGKPKYTYVGFPYADAVVDHIPCPRCCRLHILLIPFDPQSNWYDELIAIDEAAKEFRCWNCGQEFITDEMRNVFIKIDDHD